MGTEGIAAMPKKHPPEFELSRRERQIMDVLFAAGEATAAEVQKQIPDAPGYTACRSLLKILEDKGFVRHREDGRRYVYAPTVSVDNAGQSAFQRVLQVFFGGSLEQAMVAHLSNPSAQLDEEELARLRSLLQDATAHKASE